MEKEQVIKLLEYYKDINNLIELCKDDINAYYEMYYVPTSIEASETRAVNKINNITENLALNIPDSVYDDIKRLEEEIRQHKEAKLYIYNTIKRLTYHQRLIINKYYIYRQSWTKIALETSYSVRQCKNIRKKAILNLKVDIEKDIIKDCPPFPLFYDIIGISNSEHNQI